MICLVIRFARVDDVYCFGKRDVVAGSTIKFLKILNAELRPNNESKKHFLRARRQVLTGLGAHD